jgi:hypothetical protein
MIKTDAPILAMGGTFPSQPESNVGETINKSLIIVDGPSLSKSGKPRGRPPSVNARHS